MFVNIALEVVQKFAVELKTAHLDSTSLSVEGQYLENENSTLEDAVPIKITHGYSRDHRADLKQFMVNLLVSEDGGIPLFLELGNGNDADKAVFVPVIQEFQKQWTITEPSVEVIVGDSAMYTSKNIQALGTTKWITLVPTTIATAKKLLESIASEQLSSIELEGYQFVELCTTYGDRPQRWIVWENKTRKNVELKKLNREMAKALKQQQKLLKDLSIKEFACEVDAENAAQEFAQTLKYHRLCSLEIIQKAHYSSVGRPRKDGQATKYSYHIQGSLELNQEVVKALKHRAGRFILATNLLKTEEWNPEQILSSYKQQQSCERGFRFIKDPLFFASSVFLKTPRRIMALAMIMALCLMVYSLGQRQLRKTLEQTEATIANQKGKPTTKPTLRWILQCFLSVHLIWVNRAKHQIKLNQRQRLIFPFLSCACQKYYLLC